MKVTSQESVIVLVIEVTVSSKFDVFKTFSSALKFPSYFSENWDSFDECINDLSWLDVEKVILIHQDWPNNNLSENTTYLDIIDRAVTNCESQNLISIYLTGE